jgi:hypothetical protein
MVARAAFHILYWSAILISGQLHGLGSGAAEAAPPSPFERRFQDLDAPDQRLYQAIREGVAEAEARRSATGEWPSIESLAAEGIPPFAEDPIDKAHYVFKTVKNKTVIDYLGTPAPGSGREAVMVVITEPEPGTAKDPLARVDEVHHRLADGTMIHVTVWMGPLIELPREPLSVLPLEQGWKQILIASTAAP